MDQLEPVRPGARLVRGWLAAMLSTTVAGLSHYAADASAPDPVLLLIAVAAAGVVCVLLAGRRMGPMRVGVAVLLSQGAYHGLFSVPALCAVPGGSVTGHVHHGAPVGHVVTSMDATACLAPAAEGHSPMLAAHLLAAAVTFLILRHGEKSWWGLVDALRSSLPQILVLVLPVIPASRPLRRAGEFFHQELCDLALARAVVSRRGPPAPVM